eukprot:1160827-Pelagomonas_calceolata.AAC.21
MVQQSEEGHESGICGCSWAVQLSAASAGWETTGYSRASGPMRLRYASAAGQLSKHAKGGLGP